MKQLIGLLTLLVLVSSAHATTYTIEFGGLGNSGAFTYAPSTLNVNVGDTIIWSGDFSSHPLVSTSVPSGAIEIPQTNSGSSFRYIVTKVGEYDYKCVFHGSIGMAGSIVAATAGVHVTNTSNTVSQNFPNPATGHQTMIHLMLDKSQHVRIDLYDTKGTLVATPLNKFEAAGMQMISLDLLGLAPGSYSYVVTTDGAETRKSMVVIQ